MWFGKHNLFLDEIFFLLKFCINKRKRFSELICVYTEGRVELRAEIAEERALFSIIIYRKGQNVHLNLSLYPIKVSAWGPKSKQTNKKKAIIFIKLEISLFEAGQALEEGSSGNLRKDYPWRCSKEALGSGIGLFVSGCLV